MCRAVECVRQQHLPRGVPAVQRVRSQLDGTEPKEGPPFQEPNLLRSAFRRRGSDGVIRFYAATTQLQTAVARMRRRPPQEQHHPHFPAASASLFRLATLHLSLPIRNWIIHFQANHSISLDGMCIFLNFGWCFICPTFLRP